MRTLIWLSSLLFLASCSARGGGGDDDDSADDDDSSADDDDASDDDDAADDDDASGPTQVRIESSAGSFVVELFEEEAPITTANFLAYVDAGFFDGTDDLGATIMHRVLEDFVVQGGGFTVDLEQKETMAAIVNEAVASELSNTRGTLSMARTPNPNSATSQWFVNLVDNTFLDPGGSSAEGYAVFAEVVEGMDVVDAIGAVAVSDQGSLGDVPNTPIVFEAVERL